MRAQNRWCEKFKPSALVLTIVQTWVHLTWLKPTRGTRVHLKSYNKSLCHQTQFEWMAGNTKLVPISSSSLGFKNNKKVLHLLSPLLLRVDKVGKWKTRKNQKFGVWLTYNHKMAKKKGTLDLLGGWPKARKVFCILYWILAMCWILGGSPNLEGLERQKFALLSLFCIFF